MGMMLMSVLKICFHKEIAQLGLLNWEANTPKDAALVSLLRTIKLIETMLLLFAKVWELVWPLFKIKNKTFTCLNSFLLKNNFGLELNLIKMKMISTGTMVVRSNFHDGLKMNQVLL